MHTGKADGQLKLIHHFRRQMEA